MPKQAVISAIPKLRISKKSKEQLEKAFKDYPEFISSQQLQEVFDHYDRRQATRRQVSM